MLCINILHQATSINNCKKLVPTIYKQNGAAHKLGTVLSRWMVDSTHKDEQDEWTASLTVSFHNYHRQYIFNSPHHSNFYIAMYQLKKSVK